MNPLSLISVSLTNTGPRIREWFWPAVILLSFILLIAVRADLVPLIVSTLSDAYLAVSVFVAATLLFFNILELVFKIDLAEFIARNLKWQTVFASVLGALPGCGGAIMVTTYFIRGRISFGALVATLTATMGDAAFLLIAQEPLTGVAVFFMGIVVGIFFGGLVDRIHGPDFMRPKSMLADTQLEQQNTELVLPAYLLGLFILLLVPGLIIGLAQALQQQIPAWLGAHFPLYLGFMGAVFSIGVWVVSKHKVANSLQSVDIDKTGFLATEKQKIKGGVSFFDQSVLLALGKTLRDTSFITTWVAMGFLSYEVSLELFELDLSQVLRGWVALLPLLAILIGFLPGCGPQILVTTLYLNGALPLSAQLGNAISNDGDALFPALALAPAAAVVATLYSAVPAIFIAYGYLWLFE